jgi:hypothetical protein
MFTRSGCYPAGVLSTGRPCTVDRLGDGREVSLRCFGPVMVQQKAASFDSFRDFLYSWGGQWMWEHIRLFGPMALIAQAL